MPTPPVTSLEELSEVLAGLALAASGFVRGRGREAARRTLLASIIEANRVLRAECEVRRIDIDASDPEQIIRAYIAAGGVWRELAAAVNRMALAGCRSGRMPEQ